MHNVHWKRLCQRNPKRWVSLYLSRIPTIPSIVFTNIDATLLTCLGPLRFDIFLSISFVIISATDSLKAWKLLPSKWNSLNSHRSSSAIHPFIVSNIPTYGSVTTYLGFNTLPTTSFNHVRRLCSSHAVLYLSPHSVSQSDFYYTSSYA